MIKQDNYNNQLKQESGTDKITVPVVEEQVLIDKVLIESGKVNITKKVHHVTENLEIPVIEENVSVNRIEINQYIDTAPAAIRQEGEKTIIPILKEVFVVQKKLLLVEEIHITRKQDKKIVTKQETLRKEEIIVSRDPVDPS